MIDSQFVMIKKDKYEELLIEKHMTEQQLQRLKLKLLNLIDVTTGEFDTEAFEELMIEIHFERITNDLMKGRFDNDDDSL